MIDSKGYKLSFNYLMPLKIEKWPERWFLISCIHTGVKLMFLKIENLRFTFSIIKSYQNLAGFSKEGRLKNRGTSLFSDQVRKIAFV